MDLYEIEKQREMTMVSKGVERFYEHQSALAAQGKEWDAAPAAGLIAEMTQVLVPRIKAVQVAARKKYLTMVSEGGGRLQGWEPNIVTLDPVMLAYVTVRTIVARTGATKHVMINYIGSTIMLEIQFESMRHEEGQKAKAESRRNRIESLKRQVKEIGPRTIRKWMKKLDDLEALAWDYDTRIAVGLIMFEAAQLGLPEYLDIATVPTPVGRGMAMRKAVHARLNEATEARLKGRLEELANASPWLVPMVCPPRDWHETRAPSSDGSTEGYAYKGGYLVISKPMIKEDGIKHTSTQPWVCGEILDAVNAVQRTPWRVNRRVLNVATTAYQWSLGEVLPVAPPQSLPPAIDDDAWALMSTEARGKHKNERRAIHDSNNRLEHKRKATRRALGVAQEHVDFDRLYFPHNLDFRGRMYPLPQDLQPQGDDFSRGLLEFGDGKALGDSGLRWLCHVVAGTFGADKISIQDQCDWCTERMDEIHAVALYPLGAGFDFWTQAEDPWQFLAASIALEGALSHPGGPQEYVCHLPCHVDGTCNGLQHLSAMGRDEIGAVATNLSADAARQDIYQIVADKVTEAVNADALIDDNLPAAAWLGRVTRKTVKRGVMTTPYGVTPEGIRAQLIGDRLCEGLAGDKLKNASYLRDQMLDAIDGTIIMGRAIMEWMQLVAVELSSQGKPIKWTSPVGLHCVQEYRLPCEKRVQTLLGRTKYLSADRSGGLRKAKQKNSIAPNIVHSYDAAHLMKTVNASVGDDVTSFAVVHDSFGTHAADVDALSHHLRDQFVEMYSDNDWLATMAGSFAQQLGYLWIDGKCDNLTDEGWVLPPDRGEFDIEEVRRSRYFFF